MLVRSDTRNQLTSTAGIAPNTNAIPNMVTGFAASTAPVRLRIRPIDTVSTMSAVWVAIAPLPLVSSHATRISMLVQRDAPYGRLRDGAVRLGSRAAAMVARGNDRGDCGIFRSATGDGR